MQCRKIRRRRPDLISTETDVALVFVIFAGVPPQATVVPLEFVLQQQLYPALDFVLKRNVIPHLDFLLTAFSKRKS